MPKQELDVEDGGGVAVSRMDGNARGRSLLSRVSKMYDIDGDGELNAAERALREMDTSNRGFITNERAYKLMTEHMDMQREMFKMKKVIASLICFTVILALSNLGTSFASAILAKDATVSNGALTNKKGETLATNTEADTFPAATYYSGNEASRERVRRLCQDADGDGDFDGDFMERADGSTVWMNYHACEDEIHDGTLYLSREDGIALIERCRIERRVQIKRVWDHDASIQTMIQICPHDRGTYTAPGAEHPEVTWGGNDDTRIGPALNTNGAIYSIWGNRFTSDLGQPCDEDADCDTRQNLSCVENTCSTG